MMGKFESGKSYHTRGGGIAMIKEETEFFLSGSLSDSEGCLIATKIMWWKTGKYGKGDHAWDLLTHEAGYTANVESDFEQLHEHEQDGFIRTYKTNNAPFNAEEAWKATKLAAGDAL
jgi:hypothetical protein